MHIRHVWKASCHAIPIALNTATTMRGGAHDKEKGVQAFVGRRESEKSQPPSSFFLACQCLKTDRPFATGRRARIKRSEEHTSELQSRRDLVCRLLLEK